MKLIYTFVMYEFYITCRYVKVLRSGLRARQTGEVVDIEICYHQQNDACMLRLFESFLESAPQLCLQLYIIIYTADAHWLTGEILYKQLSSFFHL